MLRWLRAGMRGVTTRSMARRESAAPASIEQHIERKPLLSVTDVVSPAWCEYAFQYNVLSQAHLPLAKRPRTIVTPEGNTLVPSWAALLQRDAVMRAGAQVHDKLERQVQPVRVEFRVESTEEEWALLALRLVSALHQTLVHGCAREVPVFGIVNGRLVRGVIDELRRCEDAPFMRLSDTKTRFSTRLPSERDQMQSKLQCMLYKRLMDGVLSGSAAASDATVAEADPHAVPLRLQSMFELLQLDLGQKLSPAFLASMHELVSTTDTPWTAADLAALGCEPASEYTPPAREPGDDVPNVACVVNMAQQALDNTLRKFCVRRVMPTLSRRMSLVYTQRPKDGGESAVLGTVRFDADADTLEAFITSIFRLFEGRRTLEGVHEAAAHRCWSCAWRDGCEWRDRRANDAYERAQASRSARQAAQVVMSAVDDDQLWGQFVDDESLWSHIAEQDAANALAW